MNSKTFVVKVVREISFIIRYMQVHKFQCNRCFLSLWTSTKIEFCIWVKEYVMWVFSNLKLNRVSNILPVKKNKFNLTIVLFKRIKGWQRCIHFQKRFQIFLRVLIVEEDYCSISSEVFYLQPTSLIQLSSTTLRITFEFNNFHAVWTQI